MEIHIVATSDWEDSCRLRATFTKRDVAELCVKYHEMLNARDDKTYGLFGRRVHLISIMCSDDEDFGAKIKELEEDERRERQEKEDAIREADMKEYNRIKNKYGL